MGLFANVTQAVSQMRQKTSDSETLSMTDFGLDVGDAIAILGGRTRDLSG
jgi:hypothetical protein